MMAASRASDRATKRLVVILTGVGLLIVFGFFGWVFYTTGGFAWTGGSKAIAIALVAGAVGVGALTGVLMWLAFYSSRKGYDDPPTFDDHDGKP
jgi:cation transporter-like permease